MSRRQIVIACALVVTALSAVPADAGWREFHYRTMLDWHRNNAWPQPWVHVDRLATCRIFDLQAQNGWCQQSTLTAFHFNMETNELTEAGRNKVRQIMTQHPESFRTLFVVMGKSEEQTATRVDSVQQTAVTISDGALPQIRRVAIPPRGWPAEDVDAITNRYARFDANSAHSTVEYRDDDQLAWAACEASRLREVPRGRRASVAASF